MIADLMNKLNCNDNDNDNNRIEIHGKDKNGFTALRDAATMVLEVLKNIINIIIIIIILAEILIL